MKVKKLHPNALLPHRAHATDSGADLFAVERTVLPARSITKVHTGGRGIARKYVRYYLG